MGTRSAGKIARDGSIVSLRCPEVELAFQRPLILALLTHDRRNKRKAVPYTAFRTYKFLSARPDERYLDLRHLRL